MFIKTDESIINLDMCQAIQISKNGRDDFEVYVDFDKGCDRYYLAKHTNEDHAKRIMYDIYDAIKGSKRVFNIDDVPFVD